jgi:hypothetical protein
VLIKRILQTTMIKKGGQERERKKRRSISIAQVNVVFWTGPMPYYVAKIKISSHMEHDTCCTNCRHPIVRGMLDYM